MFLIQFDVMFGMIGGDYWQRMSYNNWYFATYFMGLMCLCFMLSYFFLVVAEKPFGKYVKFSLQQIQTLMAPPKQNRAFAAPQPQGTVYVAPGEKPKLSMNSGDSGEDAETRGSRRSKRSQRRSHLTLNASSNQSRGSNRSAQEDLIFFDESDNEQAEGQSVGEGAGSQTGQQADRLMITSRTPTNQEVL